MTVATMSKRQKAQQKEASRRDLGVSQEERCQLRLGRVIRAAKARLGADAPAWRSGRSPLVAPPGYFEPFAREVVEILYEHLAQEAEQRVVDLQGWLAEDTQMYIRECHAYKERTLWTSSPSARRPSRRRRRDEELYLYEPLKYWESEQQRAMREIINQRLRLMLADPSKREQMMESKRKAEERKNKNDIDKEAAADAAERAERKAERERKERARLELEKRRKAMEDAASAAAGVQLGAQSEKVEGAAAQEEELIVPPHVKKGLAAAAAEKEKLLKQIEEEKARALAAEAERDRLLKLKATRESEVKSLGQRLKELQEQIAKLKTQLSATGKVADVDLSEFDVQPSKAPPEKPKPKGAKAPPVQVKKTAKKASVDEAALQRLVEDAVDEARRRIEEEKAMLFARIKELEEEIKRIKALLAEGPKQRTPHSRVVVEQKETRRPRYKPVEKVVSAAPRRGGTRRIFARLHQDAAQRVTRMICRRESSDAEKAKETNRKFGNSNPDDDGARMCLSLSCTQLEAAAEQLDRFGPEARRKEMLRQRERFLALQTTSQAVSPSTGIRAVPDGMRGGVQHWSSAENIGTGELDFAWGVDIASQEIWKAEAEPNAMSQPQLTLSKQWVPMVQNQAQAEATTADARGQSQT